jgi:hypothetical protein
MVRDGKPKGFFYLDHRTVDGKCNIITDTHVTAANIHDSIPYLERLDHQRKKFGFEVEHVGLDAGYYTPPLCKGLDDRNIYGVIAYRKPNHKKGYFYKRQFTYLPDEDCYLCPENQKIKYKTTDRKGYRMYHSNPDICSVCLSLHKCTHSRNRIKVVTRHVWDDSKERINQNRLQPKGKKIYSRRKETIERSFADSKQLHGLRYARYRGLKKVYDQCLLTAACQNMKKIANMVA